MSINEIQIIDYIQEDQQKTVATIVYRAFQRKFAHMWIFNKSEEQAVAFLLKGLCFENGIYAVRNGMILGVLGLNTGKGKCFFKFTLDAFTHSFGWLGGASRYLRYVMEMFFHMRINDHQVKIDSIAVSEEARGMGIGSRLMEGVSHFARKSGKNSIILEVVDTNSRAKRLYERAGFKTVRYLNTDLFTKSAGFTGVFHMRKVLS